MYDLDNGTQIVTLLSNDSGVAFIVRTREGTVYHAGDLNDWYWEGEPEADNQRLTSAYRAEIRKIKGMHFDAAFVPVDPRQEEHYADGILYFLENVDCNAIFQCIMDDASVIKRFVTEYPQYKSRIKNTEGTKRRSSMKFKMIHENYNVSDLDRSIQFTTRPSTCMK